MKNLLTIIGVAAIAGAIALVGSTATAGTEGVDHVRTFDQPQLEVSPELLEQGYVNTLAGVGVPTEKARATYDDVCKLLDAGYQPEAVAGFLDRQADLTARQAVGASLAGREFCPGWGTLGAQLDEGVTA